PGRPRDRRPRPGDRQRDRRAGARRSAGDRRQGPRNRPDRRRGRAPLRRPGGGARRRRPAGERRGHLMPTPSPVLWQPDRAAAAPRRSTARFIAVTGSVGKTGTKEALRLALGVQGATFASAGNLNNHWGVPLSLARLPPDVAYGVFELGMNHAGEIAQLTRQV